MLKKLRTASLKLHLPFLSPSLSKILVALLPETILLPVNSFLTGYVRVAFQLGDVIFRN